MTNRTFESNSFVPAKLLLNIKFKSNYWMMMKINNEFLFLKQDGRDNIQQQVNWHGYILPSFVMVVIIIERLLLYHTCCWHWYFVFTGILIWCYCCKNHTVPAWNSPQLYYTNLLTQPELKVTRQVSAWLLSTLTKLD